MQNIDGNPYFVANLQGKTSVQFYSFVFKRLLRHDFNQVRGNINETLQIFSISIN